METVNKKIILAVDDSLLICKQIRAALADMPVFLCEAHSGREALELAEQYQPDLILLDVVLPDTDGYQLFRRLKEADKNNASIIFLTSKDKDEDCLLYTSCRKSFRTRETMNLHTPRRLNPALCSPVENVNFM